LVFCSFSARDHGWTGDQDLGGFFRHDRKMRRDQPRRRQTGDRA
jgi:hypothetical protein